MPRSLGVEITIGAVLASSVMSSLGSVTQKFEGLNGKIRSAGQAATVTGKALELAVKKADIEARVGDGATSSPSRWTSLGSGLMR